MLARADVGTCAGSALPANRPCKTCRRFRTMRITLVYRPLAARRWRRREADLDEPSRGGDALGPNPDLRDGVSGGEIANRATRACSALAAVRARPTCVAYRIVSAVRTGRRTAALGRWDSALPGCPNAADVVAEARRLPRRAKGKARLSYREISTRLKDAGYCNERGQAFNPQSVRAMIEGPQPRRRRPSGAD